MKNTSDSKKIQHGFLVLFLLLVIGTVFIGAGSAGSWVVNLNPSESNVNLADLQGFPTTIKQGDRVTVEIAFSGTPSNAYQEVRYTVNALGGMSGTTLSLQSPSASWYLERCGVSVSYAGSPTVIYTPSESQTASLPCPEEISTPIEFSGVINASGTGNVLAKLTLSGTATTEIEVPSNFYTTVSTEGAFSVSKTITVTYTESVGSGSTDIPQSPIQTQTQVPTPITQTIPISDDGSVSFTAGGISYGVNLGEGATGNVIVTPLGEDVKLPEKTEVLAGSDISITQPLASGKTATVSMGISKSKLPAGVADVVMQHFNAKTGQWEDLPTLYTESGSTVRYFGETASFSPFILVQKENGAAPVTAQHPTSTEPTEKPTETPASPGFGVLAVLAGLGAVAIFRRT